MSITKITKPVEDLSAAWEQFKNVNEQRLLDPYKKFYDSMQWRKHLRTIHDLPENGDAILFKYGDQIISGYFYEGDDDEWWFVDHDESPVCHPLVSDGWMPLPDYNVKGENHV